MVRKRSRKEKSGRVQKTEPSEETITINKTTLWQGLTAVLAIALVAVILIAFTGNGTAQVPAVPGTTPQPSPSPGGSGEVSLEGANMLGDENAPVVFVEYSSFTCPFCGRFNDETYPLIVQNFVETGQVLYVYKHFVRNDMDIVAANAAECAGEQGLFFEYKNAIYDNQQSIGQPGFFENLAQTVGVNMGEWQTCFEEGRYNNKAVSDRDEGISNGIQGTPGFVINGETFARGAQPFSVFEQVIQQALQS